MSAFLLLALTLTEGMYIHDNQRVRANIFSRERDARQRQDNKGAIYGVDNRAMQ